MLKKTLSIFSKSRSILFSGHSLVDPTKFYFARKIRSKVAKPTEEPEEKEEKQISESEDEEEAVVEKITKKDIMDPKSDEIDDKWLAQSYLPPQQLPEKLLTQCQKVFSKFPQSEVRKMGTAYLKLYQVLHASEKPTDLTKTPPFANTSELINSRSALVYLGRKRRNQDPDEADPKKDKPKKTVEPEINKPNPEEKADQGLEYDQNMALAYLQRKMPHTYGVAARVLTEAKYRLPDFEPKTFLDYGAGLGSGSYAFKEVFQKFDKVVAIEPAPAMRKLGKFLTEDIKKINWFDSLARIVNVADLDGFFDVVYCGYVLEEAKDSEARKLIIEALWQKVRPNGIMILVEPGSPKGFRFVHDFRNWIINKSRLEANIVGPCPHHNECPMAREKYIWCNFEQTVAKYPNRVFTKLAKQSTMDREKFSYLIVRKGINYQYSEVDTPAERSFTWGKIIKKVLKRKGHAIFDVCNKAGKLERKIIAKSHGREDYKNAKRLKWGDLWYLPDRIPNKFRKEGLRTERMW